MRTLDPSLEAASLASTVAPIVLVECLFDSGAVRMWTGIGTLNWRGVDWLGGGNLMSLGAVEETQELRATGLDVALSGIPPELISLALNEKYQGRECLAYFGALNTNTGALVGSPYEIFSGRMDVMTLEEEASSATIRMSVESRLIDLERARERRYDHQDQKLIDPDDKFFEYVSSMVDVEITWGQP